MPGFVFALLLLILTSCYPKNSSTSLTFTPDDIAYHIVNPDHGNFFITHTSGGTHFSDIKDSLSRIGESLHFAMNGGIYKPDYSPQGLLITNGEIISPRDTSTGIPDNFHMTPNGIFWVTNTYEVGIGTSENFDISNPIQYATQSGPMLLIDGQFHPRFRQGSSNVHIRNGVGILPNGNLLFAISTKRINFYDFANFFKKNGCKNALYLDGFVSRVYLPSKNIIQLDRKFGVVIGEKE